MNYPRPESSPEVLASQRLDGGLREDVRGLIEERSTALTRELEGLPLWANDKDRKELQNELYSNEDLLRAVKDDEGAGLSLSQARRVVEKEQTRRAAAVEKMESEIFNVSRTKYSLAENDSRGDAMGAFTGAEDSARASRADKLAVLESSEKEAGDLLSRIKLESRQ